MDAFFVKTYEYEHPYFLRLWCSSTFEGSSLLLTFDGVKIRLINFLSHQTIKEVDFLNHQSLSYVTSIYHPGYPSKAIFLFVRDRRNIWAYDDQLANIPSLSIDTSLIILAMVWSQQKQILYISGNFGWMRALKIKVSTSISGNICEWIPIWTKHESGQWMQHLALDEPRGYLFGASGIDVFVWSLSDGQLLLQYDSKHTHAITSLRYSSDHLLLFTASSDGTIKIWRIFDRKPDLIRTLKQVDLGPMLLEIDSSTIISMSCERILRRYNMINGSVLGSHDLEPSVSLDQKNIDSPLQLNIGYTENVHGKHEWLFESEGFKVSVFEVHYAPRELAICCDIVSHVVVDPQSTVYAVCRNGVLHVLHTDASEQRTIDLDTIPLTNDPDHVLNPSNILHVAYSNGYIYLAYESGEIKALNTNTFEFFKMREPDLGKSITALCTTSNILISRHNYCPSSADLHSLVLSCSSNGGFTVHCALCYNFIASWKLSNSKIIQIKMVPNRQLLAAIDQCHFYIYKESNNMLAKVCTFEFEEEEYASCFTFASDNLIVVGMISGKATILDLIEGENNNNISLNQRLIIRMHSNRISTILSCAELKNIDECKDIYDSFNLDGIVCSIGIDDTLKITDCFTGILQYFSVLPVHTTAHTATFVYQAKIMLAISIDQNIRLWDWPGFERLLPSAHESPRSEPEIPIRRAFSSSSMDDYSDDSFNFHPKNSFNNSMNSNNQAKNEFSIFNELNQDNKGYNNENKSENLENQNVNQKKPLVKKQRVDLVFENGFPKLKFENINNEEEEEEEEEINKEEEEEINKEVEIKNDFYLNDILKEPSRDEAIERNRQILEKAISNDPEIEDTIKTKRVKKITRIKEEYNDENEDVEVEDNNFYDYLFAPNVKHYEKKKKNIRATTPQTKFKLRGLPLEKPERIPKIGSRRKGKTSGRTKHFVVLEFENGKQIKTSELTLDMLKEIAKANTKVEETTTMDLTPGYVFQQALIDLRKTKNRPPKHFLIREQELVALPIFTLTSGGINVGANYRRFFTNKPSKKFYEERYKPSIVLNANDGKVHVNRFMHWEGVEFDHSSKKSNVIGMHTVIEEVQGKNEEEEDLIDDNEEDEDEDCSLISEILRKARKSRRSKLKLKEHFDSYDPDLFDPSNFGSTDGNHGEFNFFEKDNPLSKALVTASPSVSAITQMINDDDDNPLLSLISNTPFISPAQLMAQVDDDRMSQIAMWQRQTGDDVAVPNIVNTFTFEGLSDKFKIDSSNPNERPASPRAMDALFELTKRMEVNQPLLPIISEDSLNEISPYSSSASDNSDDDDDDDDEEIIFLKSQFPTKLMRTQSIIQEHLQRTDFKALKDALNDAGLITDNALIDLPRWQPTVNFMTRHQKGVHPFTLSQNGYNDNSSSTDDDNIDNNIIKDSASKNQSLILDDLDINENAKSNSPQRSISESKYKPRQKRPRKSYSKSLSIGNRKLSPEIENDIENENENNNNKSDDESASNEGDDNDNEYDNDKINNNKKKNNENEEDYDDYNGEESNEEEDEDLNELIASVNNKKAIDYLSKIDLNKDINQIELAKIRPSGSSYKNRKRTEKTSSSVKRERSPTKQETRRRSSRKLDKDFGLSRDGKKYYKTPKGGFKNQKFDKVDPIEEIQIKTKNRRKRHQMALFLPMVRSTKSETIKSLLKERPDHIEIDFGDPKLYQAGLKKYYVKSLASKGPRFQRHKIGTKNPLLMAHGSDSDDNNDHIFDETIKKVDIKKRLKHSKSFATMPLPRLSPRDDEINEENEEEYDEYEESEDEYSNNGENVEEIQQNNHNHHQHHHHNNHHNQHHHNHHNHQHHHNHRRHRRRIRRLFGEEEEEEEGFISDEDEYNANFYDEEDENEDNGEFEDEDLSEYEYEYEYDEENGVKKRVKKRKENKKKNLKKKPISSESLKLKNLQDSTTNMKNPLINHSSRSSSHSTSRSSSTRSSRLSSRYNLKKKKNSLNIQKIPSDDEGDPNMIIGTLKMNGKSPSRKRRTIPKKPKKSIENDNDDEDLVKEMDELLKDAENKEEDDKKSSRSNKNEEEKAEIIPVEEEEQIDTVAPIDDTPPDTSKKLKKKTHSRVRKSKAAMNDDDEARQLFESLINATRTSTRTINSTDSDLASLFGNDFRQGKNNENRKFGQGVKYFKRNEFQSTKKKKIIVIKKFDWNMSLKVRYASTSNLLKKKRELYQRRTMFMLGRINMIKAPEIFLSYDAQTLWDQNIGKMRRNSFDSSTKNMKKF